MDLRLVGLGLLLTASWIAAVSLTIYVVTK